MSSVGLSKTGRVTSITVETAAPGDQDLASIVGSLLDALVEADHTPDTDSILLMSDIDSFGLEMPMTPPPEPPVQTPGWRLVYRLLDIEKPLVVVVNTSAVDLGLALVLLSDTTVAAGSAVLGCRGLGNSISGVNEAAALLPLYVGPQRAKQIVLAGELVDGAQAGTLGLVNQVARDDEARNFGASIAELYAGQPRYAARATKRVVNRYIRWAADQVADISIAFDSLARAMEDGEALRGE